MANSTYGRVIGLGLDAPDPLRYNGGANSGPPGARFIEPTFRTPHHAWSGRYKLAGTTTDAGTPVSRRVLVSPMYSIQIIRDTYSDASSGAWEFIGLAPGKYLIIGIDVSGEHNAVVFSHVDAVAM